ncbi:YIEGIA domain-containing protein [Marasmitruncus massiliensis]|uniref:YIEGIA domain-containing protein n=1 Tax=Marasmitruncus massiliensis TaxID=1944642 RepID=UPI001FA8A483|nr:YIEGIA domain-containing protein [Marasmitruncus massiliensis]
MSKSELIIIVIGIITGTAARLITLCVDFRQVPTYPSALFNNVVQGFIAASLGAVAIPAVLAGDFAAVTFLTVAVQQFRDIRTAEMESLGNLEHTEYAKRGQAYIDGISKTFESRSYISLVTSFVSVLVMQLTGSGNILLLAAFGTVSGAVVMIALYRFTKGKMIGIICDIVPGKIEVKGSELYVDGIFVTNFLGTDLSRELMSSQGLAVVIKPRDEGSRMTLENAGQRQAVAFEAFRTLGVKQYNFVRRDIPSGKVILAFVPIERDMDKLIYVVSHTPILENSRKIKRIMKQ